jgi:hypothetical protein
MSTLRALLCVAVLAGSAALAPSPAAAGGWGEPRCCSWFPGWLFGRPPAPAYYAGPLSGATYEHYYGSYWGSRHWHDRQERRPRAVK